MMTWNGVDVERPGILNEESMMTGRAFHVVRRTLAYHDGRTITRDVVMHPPVVAVLVHNTDDDTYLIEREYRSGVDAITYGVPAGFMESSEQPMASMLRELREETGIAITDAAVDDNHIHAMGYMDSSEGFTNERTYLFIIDITGNDYQSMAQSLDDDEYIQYEWAPAHRVGHMLDNGAIHGASSMMLIQKEMLRRHREVMTDIG